MVDRVVQEQHLRGLHDERHQREQPRVDQRVGEPSEALRDPVRERADEVQADDRHDAADDARGEVVDEHLEAALDLAGDGDVPLLEQPGRQRAEDEGREDGRADLRDGGRGRAVSSPLSEIGASCSATGASIAPMSATAPTTPPR